MVAAEQIDDRGKPRTHFIMIPNMAGKDLDPFEYRLYGHYSEVCGQEGGRCWQSVKTIHEKTGISLNTITKTRNSLQAKGYIDVVMPDGKTRSRGENTSVGIVDRWQENTERCKGAIQQGNAKTFNNVMLKGDSPFVPVQEEVKEEKQEQEKNTTTGLPDNLIPVTIAPVVVSSSDGQQLAITIYKPVTPVPSKPVPVIPIKLDTKFARIVTAYHELFKQMIPPRIHPMIKLAVDEYAEDWILDAMKLAAEKGKCFWEYVNGILERWKAQGGKYTGKPALIAYSPTTSVPSSSATPQFYDASKDLAYRVISPDDMIRPEDIREFKR